MTENVQPETVTLRDATIGECCAELARRLDGIVVCGNLRTGNGEELLIYTNGGACSVLGLIEICRRAVGSRSHFIPYQEPPCGGAGVPR